MATITRDSLSTEVLVNRLRKPNVGCIMSYVGIVRETSSTGQAALSIEFSSNEEAKDKLTWIENEARQRFDVQEVVISHRIGQFLVTDVILAVAISAAHRQAAFAACEWIVDEVKHVHSSWAVEELKN